jgi:hypothetical protein
MRLGFDPPKSPLTRGTLNLVPFLLRETLNLVLRKTLNLVPPLLRGGLGGIEAIIFVTSNLSW